MTRFVGSSLARSRRSFWPVGLWIPILVIGLSLATGAPADAKVFASQNQAIEEAFPQATRVDRETRVLRSNEVAEI